MTVSPSPEVSLGLFSAYLHREAVSGNARPRLNCTQLLGYSGYTSGVPSGNGHLCLILVRLQHQFPVASLSLVSPHALCSARVRLAAGDPPIFFVVPAPGAQQRPAGWLCPAFHPWPHSKASGSICTPPSHHHSSAQDLHLSCAHWSSRHSLTAPLPRAMQTSIAVAGLSVSALPVLLTALCCSRPVHLPACCPGCIAWPYGRPYAVRSHALSLPHAHQ